MPEQMDLISIQTVYNLHVSQEGKGRLYCKNVIKIPIAEPVVRKLEAATYNVIPYTALVFENSDVETMCLLKIVIETNEGITVEPIVAHPPLVPYDIAFLLTLPRGTTGIKKAYLKLSDAYGPPIQTDIVFDIMKPPYNYENPLFTILNNRITQLSSAMSNRVNDLDSKIASLESRVTRLESIVVS